jgi:predicted Zn-dependent protease
MTRVIAVCASVLATAAIGHAAVAPPKPGWNLFSANQDIQLGREARSEVERKMPVVHNSEVSRYLSALGAKLARSRYAGHWPYTFELVGDKDVNAFSLPGGPVYVDTGLIPVCENEAQLAGVLAHEMSHIELRHATNQASKANLIKIPAMIAGGVMGGSLLGGLAQLGIGLGANSVLLSFSRSAEAQADYNGVLILADAGYNPIEMARFFEKLQAQAGRSSALSRFLSDHPDPGNRVKAVEDEIRQLPQREYREDSGQFQHIKDVVRHLPNHGELRNSFIDQHSPVTPDVRPSSQFRDYQTEAYTIAYPDNWEALGGDQNSMAATLAPRDALFQNGANGMQIGYGAMISYFAFIAPKSEFDTIRPVFDRMLQSIRFR